MDAKRDDLNLLRHTHSASYHGDENDIRELVISNYIEKTVRHRYESQDPERQHHHIRLSRHVLDT